VTSSNYVTKNSFSSPLSLSKTLVAPLAPIVFCPCWTEQPT